MTSKIRQLKKDLVRLRRDWIDFQSVLRRHQWPSAQPSAPTVAIVVVNYNTADLVSGMIFSLYRILGREHFSRVVVVDNGSTDGSVPILQELEKAGLIKAIFNTKQQYHGRGLNQGINYLSDEVRRGALENSYVWILDSDVVVLRPDAVTEGLAFAKNTKAGLVGQFQYDALPEGYAHVSSLLVNPSLVWRGTIFPFDDSGSPAKKMHLSLRKRQVAIADYPFRDQNFVLHIGRGTIAKIHATEAKGNRHYRPEPERVAPHFHGNPNGQEIYNQFLGLLHQEIRDFTPEEVTAACSRPGRLAMDLSAFVKGS